METISVRRAAAELRCTITYVYQLLWAGRIDGATKVGRQWKIPSEAINKRVSSSQAISSTIASPKVNTKNSAQRLEVL
jgi:excisionase family DNA binding protein